MDFDRRSALLSATLLLLAGCAPSASQAVKPKAKKKPGKYRDMAGWQAFKAAHLLPDGRIVDTGNNGISHTEGQGYAMVVAACAGDRAAFDAIHGWAERTLARPYDALFSWRYVPTDPVPVADTNNATDGDMLIAWGLMLAHDRWGDKAYADRAAEIRHAIAAQCIRRQGDRTLLLPGIQGFDKPDRTTINLSYYIWPALDAFHAADPDGPWGAIIRDGEKLVAEGSVGPLDLPTDWTDVPMAGGSVAPAADKSPRFGFDAVRVPLYLMLGGRAKLAQPVGRFWASYLDQGKAVPAWVDVVTGEVAPYPLSPGAYAIVARLLNRDIPAAHQTAPDYYAKVLALLTAM